MNNLLILGNAKDRANQMKFISEWKDEIWMCNLAFKEYKEFPRLDLIGSVHEWVAKEAIKFKKENNLNYRVLCNNFTDLEGIQPFTKYRGLSTGIELIYQAIAEGCDEIYLGGYCFINNCLEDIYTPGVYCGNFQRQWELLQEEKPKNVRIKFCSYFQ